MSNTTTPISPTRFSAALAELPISSLHAKISELQNSISHLVASNTELENFVREENDKDCYEALLENRDTIKRMEERIELVRREIVEVRGLPLMPEEEKKVNREGEGMEGVEREREVSAAEALEESYAEVPDHGVASENGVRGATVRARREAIAAHQEAQRQQQAQRSGTENGATGNNEEEENGVFL